MRTIRMFLLSFVLLAAAPAPFTPYLVKDINPEFVSGSSDPSRFIALGDLIIFQISNLGRAELWRSDGTASGTYRLLEGYFSLFANTRDLGFFEGAEGLWVTDGTLPGTFQLADVHPVSSAAWIASQGALYFAAELPGQDHGVELWRSDGTPGGTYEVLDIEPGPYSSYPEFLTSFQGRLYFAANDKLWKSDGTAQGTVLVRDVQAESLRVLGSRLIFLGTDAAHGQELWTSNGTAAGTRRISDLAKGQDSPSFYFYRSVIVGKRLYFAASIGSSGQELYTTDGTKQGTRKLTSFATPWPFSYDHFVVPLGDRGLFSADDGTHGSELWSTDGTPEGTRMVLDACPGGCASDPVHLVPHQGRTYYQATDGTHGSELWVTDGTPQGTRMFKDTCPGVCGNWTAILSSPDGPLFFTGKTTADGPYALWATDGTGEGTMPLGMAVPNEAAVAAGLLFFAGTDPDHGREPWVSNGTPEGTHLVADIAREDAGGSRPAGLMRLGSSVLFSAQDSEGFALWRSDGTEAGTTVVKRGVTTPSYLAGSAGRLFFTVRNSERSSNDLWTSDGSEAGTLRVTPDGVDAGTSRSAGQSGSRILFSARTEEHGDELWSTDGTRAGTREVVDLNPGPASSSPECLTVFRGKVWFGANSRLWKSDGTAAGTVLAFRPPNPVTHLTICPFKTFGGRLLFTLHRSRSPQHQLWSTDGTVAGTWLLESSRGFDPTYVVYRGRLWFLSKDVLWSTDGISTKVALVLPAEDGVNQMMTDGARLYFCMTAWESTGLWVSDGTEDGTQKISDLDQCFPWASLGGRLYFAGGLDDTLYRSDGTRAGTRPVRPDGQPDRVADLFPFGGQLLAYTDDGEVWQTDGTPGGTKLVLSPAIHWTDLVKAGSRLFFPGWGKETGWELWAMQE